MRFFAVIAVLLGAACAERVTVRPTERMSVVNRPGQPAASYEIRTDQGTTPTLAVIVWSRGARTIDNRTYVDLSVALRNTGRRTVRLDGNSLKLEAFDSGGAPLPRPRIARVMSDNVSLLAPPNTANVIRLRYELPVPVESDEIGSLRLRWSVAQDDGQRYVQFTEFRRQPDPDHYTSAVVAYDPVFGLYDPFVYGPPYAHRHVYQMPVQRVIVEAPPPPTRTSSR